MKLRTLTDNEKALYALTEVELSNAQLAWDLADDVEKAKTHIKRFHEKRNGLMKECGTQDKDDPNKYILEPKQVEEFNKKVDALLDVNVKITFPTISLKELKGIKVSAANIAAWKALKIVTK